MLEAISRIDTLTGRKINWAYAEQARKGDHICYVSDVRKLRSHYPAWGITRDLQGILDEMVAAEQRHAGEAAGI